MAVPTPNPRAELRMVVFATRSLEAETARAVASLDVKVGVHDPFIGALGLSDEVFAVGDTFVQVLEPRDDTSRVHRWMERRGGDAAYLLVVQTDDADGIVQRCGEAGVRVTFDGLFEGNRVMQLHAGDLQVLIEIDEMQDWSTWHWGKPEGHDDAVAVLTDLVAVDCVVDDPERIAALTATVLGVPHAGGTDLTLGARRVRFAAGADRGIVAVDFSTADPQRIGEELELWGTTIRLVA